MLLKIYEFLFGCYHQWGKYYNQKHHNEHVYQIRQCEKCGKMQVSKTYVG